MLTFHQVTLAVGASILLTGAAGASALDVLSSSSSTRLRAASVSSSKFLAWQTPCINKEDI